MKTATFLILAIILGLSAFRKFDFQTMQFENLGLGILYLVSFVFCIVAFVRSFKNSQD